jgi:hypothetical protein
MPIDETELASLLQDYVPRSEYDAALDAIEQATREADEHRTAAEQHTGRLSELEKKVRGRNYRDAFDRLRKEHKVRDEVADDVFRLLGIEQDADEPDEKVMRRGLEDFLKDRKHYTAEGTPRPKEIPAGEGAARGRSVAPGEPEMRVTRAQLADAGYMRQNQKMIGEATRAGLLVIDD